ncbi:MAG: MTH938/NDUFAF3 family protein [Candidatus Bathyarchaeota archaeon]|nr:MTH938/NDUFAF3 family protein [Candidatus Bathyarchaeota archaeon]MCX8177690.1 MTH938/NDUFAF3 family protein [Candidatus Bathyarchaeota archaeon]MDW8193950.1 Mth938-like domain-containing protein [Nitrososphaerota archaeon]
MIDYYDFGVMVIKGKRYTRDLIVFADAVFDGWWRREGHRVFLNDLDRILNCNPLPEILVIGTGYDGLVEVMPEVEETLRTKGIKLIVQPTREAYKTFNKLLGSGKNVAGAFHLTC